MGGSEDAVRTIGTDDPLVTVIVPAFNAASTLKVTLASISAQTYEKFEIIIVDDGSDDDTAHLAHQFCVSEPRARLLEQSNAGVAAARNAGIKVARGTFIAPVDADDVWHCDFLSRLVRAALAAEFPPVLVYALSRSIDVAGQVIGTGFAMTVSGRTFFRALLCNPVGNGSAALMRREACLAAGGYDERLRAAGAQGCEDYLMTLRLAAVGSLLGIDEYLVGYRFRAGSMSRDVARMTASEVMVRTFIAREYPALAPPRRAKRWIQGTMRLKQAWAAWENGDTTRAIMWLAAAGLRDPRATVTSLTARAISLWRRPVPSLPLGLTGEPDGVDFHVASKAYRPGSFMRLQANRMRALRAFDIATGRRADRY
jgi:hypothetical protein